MWTKGEIGTYFCSTRFENSFMNEGGAKGLSLSLNSYLFYRPPKCDTKNSDSYKSPQKPASMVLRSKVSQSGDDKHTLFGN